MADTIPPEVRHVPGKMDREGFAQCEYCPRMVWMQYADDVLPVEVCPGRDRRVATKERRRGK